jgi:uncharacterized protein (AIM24 family)
LRRALFAKPLSASDPSVGYDIQTVSGVKTAFFCGEGPLFATLRSPGKEVWLQSLPFSRLAGLGRMQDSDNS